MSVFQKKILNSDKFCIPAITFRRSGVYCSAPKGTIEYKEYWDLETDRCLNGYTASDNDWISGYNYFYLNYCPIEKTVYEKNTNRFGVTKERPKREKAFPDFYDYDYCFFITVDDAEYNGKHMAVLKSRRKGYSYKCGSMLARNYYLIPGSKSYVYASNVDYLTQDGILTKCWDYLDHIDTHTAWGKKRDVVNRSLHKRASFELKDEMGNKTEEGYKSEIIGASISKNPDKVRGKAGKLILFEEAGKCPELGDAWTMARPSVETDNVAFGLMIAFGTGGSKNSDFRTLKKMFYNPEAYNILGVDNIWDSGSPTKKCGFFVPQHANISLRSTDGNYIYMDNDGNTKEDESYEYIIDTRKPIIENATNTQDVDTYIAENCITPQEACLELSGNLFPKKELQDHLSNIMTHDNLQSHKQVGDLIFDTDGKLKWEIKQKGDIVSFPSRKGDKKTGSAVIWEHPALDAPYGLYIAGCDPYDHDFSTTDSLGSVFVYKRIQSFEGYYDLPVAEYTGRPESGADEFYENVRKLVLYYNAVLLYENQNKGLFAYFKNRHCDHLLADQPDIVKDIVSSSKVNRIKGIHMTESIKDWGESLIKDWLNEEYSPGKKNLTKILSIPLIEELISFNRKRGNYDRVMAFMMVMIYRVELHELHIKKSENNEEGRSLFDFTLFTD